MEVEEVVAVAVAVAVVVFSMRPHLGRSTWHVDPFSRCLPRENLFPIPYWLCLFPFFLGNTY